MGFFLFIGNVKNIFNIILIFNILNDEILINQHRSHA